MKVLRVAIALLAAVSARGQFSGLTTTDDGSRLWFASALRQRGTDQFLWSKIFSIDAGGVTLAAQRARSSPVPPTNDYMLDDPQVSCDGRILLFRGTLSCSPGSSCFLSEQHSATMLDVATGQQTYLGANARISRNGRYMAVYSSGNVFNPRFTLTDRTGPSTVFQGTLAPTSVSLAADGTTALTVGSTLQIVRGGSLSTLRASNVSTAAIDDAATTIIYEAGRRLFVVNLSSGGQQQLGPDDRDSFQATLSRDGQWVAYLSTIGSAAQVFFSRIDGSAWKQLTAREDGIAETTLSGDGKTVFAVAGDGSMLRIDTASGSTTTLVGFTPRLASAGNVTPGSLDTLQGTGLEGASVQIAGLTAPVVTRSSTAIWFQVPWEAPLGSQSLTVPEGGAPYFDDAVPYSLDFFAPQALPLSSAGTIAIHSDFGSLVTSANPAALGEIVHIYLTGGGAVSPPVATGTPAPLAPLSWITTPVSVVANGQQPLHVLFFGLAPGLVGVWQMDVVMPAMWSQPTLSIENEFYSLPPNSFGESLSFPSIPIKTGP